MDIEKLRAEIDKLDDELASLIQRRAGLAQKIGELKGGAPAYRPERESEILRRISGKSGPLAAERLLTVFREIISACRALEQSIRVSYLGPEGTFSEQAVRKHFGRAVEGVASASVDEAFRSAESGSAQFTVVPAENSTEGVVGRTLDLLLATPLRICGRSSCACSRTCCAARTTSAPSRKFTRTRSRSPSATAGCRSTCRVRSACR
jgi:chorismate mutase/prephenate dehydratase